MTTASEAGDTQVATTERVPGGLLRDALVVAAWSVLAGALGALAWWWLTDLPEVTRFEGKAVLQPTELTREVNIDGWFFVIALAGGLLGGVLLSGWRRRDPLITVLLAVAGGVLSSFLMLVLGGLLGPEDQQTALRSLPDGATVPMQLAPHAAGVVWVWPAAVALGCLVMWWLTPHHGHPRVDEDDTAAS